MIRTVTAFGQIDDTTATLKGTVSDPTNAVVIGATVTARNVQRSIARTTQTDDLGRYQLSLLQPGTYELSVEAQGFRTHVLRSVVLTIGQIGIYDVQLILGQVSSGQSIVAVVPLIEVERTQQANTIESRQIDNLPTISRSFIDYIFTLPGVIEVEPTQAQQTRIIPLRSSGFSIGGSNGHTNYVTIDGGENESGSGGLRIRNLSAEAIQEFQVNRNTFAAEYGFTAGTAVNVITKSGTNQLHGSGYAFYRSQKLAARDPLDFGSRKPFEQAFYPGFTLGGPLIKNKAFFFTSYEALKLDRARLRSYTRDPGVLGLTSAQAAYLTTLESAPNATDTTRRIAATLRSALQTTNYPTTMRILRESEGSFASPSRTHNWTTRLDYEMNSRNIFTGRFTLSDEDIDLLGKDNTLAPSRGTREGIRDYTAVGSWSRFFGKFINQARVQFSLSNFGETPRDLESTAVDIAGVISFGRGLVQPLSLNQKRYLFEDVLSWSRGRHSFTFGGSYRPASFDSSAEVALGGSYLFSGGLSLGLIVPQADQGALTGSFAPPPGATLTSLQAFNLGLPASWQQGIGNPTFEGVQHNLGFFAQDSWKITPNFTLDLGLRLDHDGEPEPLDANTYISPRLGFAWDVRGDHKTVLRGGVGTFVAPTSLQVFTAATALSESGEFINVLTRTLQSSPQSSAAIWAYGLSLGKLPFHSLSEAELRAFGINIGPKQPGRLVTGAASNYDSTYTIQASVGVGQQLTPNVSLEVAYQMYRGVHLPIGLENNYRESGQSVIIPGSDRGFLFGPRLEPIDPNISQQIIQSSVGNSISHGLTASLTKRVSNLFQFQANYTLSKSIDDVLDFSGIATPFLPTRRFLERGLSAFDIRHNFVANGVFDSPFKGGPGQGLLSRALADITFSPAMFLRSGIPFNLYIGSDVNGDMDLSDRPFLAPRNSGIGPNFFSVNLRFSRRFYINRNAAAVGPEGLRLEVITEAANLFNRTNFLRVNDVVCGASVQPGFINGCDPKFLTGPFDLNGRRDLPATSPLGFVSASSPRQIQFGLKVAF